jgi:demethylmenaquinone methyltransferase/2-methoxy-6-polyprenyl-1,4-benzoquinol methylase
MQEAELLDEQVRYYRARAPEYDNWWERKAQYSLAAEHQEAWFAERAELEGLVDGWLREGGMPGVGGKDDASGGRALEIACGTGNWTRRLAARFREVVAVDAAPEMIAIARDKLPLGASVTFIEADVFSWTPPPAAFDVVFFSFWLSHVPPDRFDAFWESAAAALAPGGRVIVIDNKWNDGIWPAGAERPSDFVQLRTDLSSGEAHRIVKIYYDADELAERLSALGWQAAITSTPRFFVAGHAERPEGERPVPR